MKTPPPPVDAPIVIPIDRGTLTLIRVAKSIVVTSRIDPGNPALGKTSRSISIPVSAGEDLCKALSSLSALSSPSSGEFPLYTMYMKEPTDETDVLSRITDEGSHYREFATARDSTGWKEGTLMIKVFCTEKIPGKVRIMDWKPFRVYKNSRWEKIS